MNELSPQTRPVIPHAKPPALSALAVMALVIACVPCCPFVNLLGAMMGVLALRRINASAGRLGGKRVATVAMVIGLSLAVLLSAAMLTFSYHEQQRLDTQMTTSVVEFVHAAQDNQPDKAQARWRTGSQNVVAAEAIQVFGEAATNRYGRLERISIASRTNAGSILVPTIRAACVFVFEYSQRTGSAEFQLSVSTKSIWPEWRLTGLRIDDADNGPLTLPSSPASQP